VRSFKFPGLPSDSVVSLASLSSGTNPCASHVDFAQEIVARPPTAAGHEEDEHGELPAVPPENARALEWLFDDACARRSKAEVDAVSLPRCPDV